LFSGASSFTLLPIGWGPDTRSGPMAAAFQMGTFSVPTRSLPLRVEAVDAIPAQLRAADSA
jgi:hypothetical protein